MARPRRLGLALLAVLCPVASRAATATGSASVGATVVASCSLTATTLNFGTYVGAQIDTTSTITVSCTNTTTYNVGVNRGLYDTGFQANVSGPGGALVPYRLFMDAARSHEWSVTMGLDTVAGTGNGGAQVLTVYGRAYGGKFGAPGTYNDTVTVKIDY